MILFCLLFLLVLFSWSGQDLPLRWQQNFIFTAGSGRENFVYSFDRIWSILLLFLENFEELHVGQFCVKQENLPFSRSSLTRLSDPKDSFNRSSSLYLAIHKSPKNFFQRNKFIYLPTNQCILGKCSPDYL